MNKAAQLLATRIGQDAIALATMAETIEQRDELIAQMEAILTPGQREKLQAIKDQKRAKE